jgi:ParB family chromosome partitioning protein
MAFNLGASNNSGKLQFADFLGADTPVTNVEKEIPIELLVPWENQPFKLYGEFKLNELAESIRENGLLSPIIVCPIDGGKYRIIAGHNRVEACRIAGITNIPSIVKDVDENRAKLIMADTNLCQRTELLPSERAYAYKAQQEALIALGSSRSTAEISEKYGEAK